MRFLRRLLFIFVFLLVGTAFVLWVGAFASLDRTRAHTHATAALPVFSLGASNTVDGLVQIAVGDLFFRARIAGFNPTNVAPAGDLVLLHGFPETSIMWEPLITAASAAGYRVVAFDQRGYSPGARPGETDSYAGPELVADVLAIADAVGFDQFHLVGHDWGAAVGWQTVFAAADRVQSWSALSIPHVAAFGAALENDAEQRRKSSYMLFFWTPWVPEQVFAFNGMGMLTGAMFADHPEAHVDEYIAVFSEPGALTGALNWYRAGRGGDGGVAPDMQVTTPTLFVWGNEDVAVGRAAVDGQREYLQGPFTEVELDTGHWLMATATDTVVAAVLQHIGAR